MKVTISGYIVKRVYPGIVRVEGKGAITDIEAREILGIEKAKRYYEYLEDQFRKIT